MMTVKVMMYTVIVFIEEITIAVVILVPSTLL